MTVPARRAVPLGTRSTWLTLAGVGAALGLALGAVLDSWAVVSAVRLVLVVAGSVVLGCAVLAASLGGDRRTGVDRTVLWRVATVAATVWFAAQGAQFVVDASAVVGVAPSRLHLVPAAEFATLTAPGRISAAATICAVGAVVTAAAGLRARGDRLPVVLIAVTAVGTILRPASGHMSQQTLGAFLGSAHALAAATWIGTLTALLVTVRGRSGWAARLPWFSTVALWCVAVLTVTGVIDAAVRLDSVAALVSTGYGRVVVAKTVVLAAAVAIAAVWRRRWVARAAGHRVDEAVSVRNAGIEVAVTSLAFGLAAVIATIG